MVLRKSKSLLILPILFFFIFQNIFLLRSFTLTKDRGEESPQLSLQHEWEVLDDGLTIGRDVVIDNEHNIYVLGNILNESTNTYDAALYKYNSSGQVQWNVSWGGMLDDYAYALDINNSSSIVYIVGRTESYGINNTNDIFILSYNSSGVLQKNITWGGDAWDVGVDIKCTSDFIYVVGYSDSFSSSQDIIVLKYNYSYSLMWAHTYGASESDIGYGITVDDTDNTFLTGKTTSSGNANTIIMKLSDDGTQLWNTTWGGSSSDEGRSIIVDTFGDIIVLGNTRSFGSGSTDFSLLKFNSTGDLQWQRMWGGADIDTAYTLLQDSNFDLFLIGYTESYGEIGKDACIVKYTSFGDYQWYKTRADSLEDVAYSGYFRTNDELYITGETNTQLFLTKFNPLPDTFIVTDNATDPDSDGSFTISWSESLGAENYSLFQSNITITNPDSNTIKIVEGNINKTVSFNSIEEGTYYYIVVGYNKYGNISSNVINITVQYPPDIFYLFSDANIPDLDGIVNFTWSIAQGVEYYRLFINDSLHKDNITETEFIVSNLDSGDYKVYIIAINDAGQRISNETTIYIRRSPSSFLLTTSAGIPDDDGAFELTWSKSFYAGYYVICNSSAFISEINLSVSVLLNFTPSLDLPTYRYSLIGLNNGTYYYKIIAFNEYGNVETECIQVTVSIPPPHPLERPKAIEFPYIIVIQAILLPGLIGALIFIYKKRKR